MNQLSNIFLEGPIQTGKSTMLREILAPFVRSISGFCSQRIIRDGQTTAFRIAPADAPLTCAAEDIVPDWPDTSARDCIEKGIFKGFADGHVVMHPEVFETIGLDYLIKAPAAGRLILLDEIGGHELQLPAWRDALEEILISGVPCIGVIKHAASTRRMDPSLTALNHSLHEFITQKACGEILYFDRLDPACADVRSRIEDFINRIFS